jgi:hypothetical protein
MKPKHRKWRKSVPQGAFSVKIGRYGVVRLPSGSINLRTGQRLYWRIKDGAAIATIRPQGFVPPRWITSRVKACLHARRPGRTRSRT